MGSSHSKDDHDFPRPRQPLDAKAPENPTVPQVRLQKANPATTQGNTSQPSQGPVDKKERRKSKFREFFNSGSALKPDGSSGNAGRRSTREGESGSDDGGDEPAGGGGGHDGPRPASGIEHGGHGESTSGIGHGGGHDTSHASGH